MRRDLKINARCATESRSKISPARRDNQHCCPVCTPARPEGVKIQLGHVEPTTSHRQPRERRGFADRPEVAFRAGSGTRGSRREWCENPDVPLLSLLPPSSPTARLTGVVVVYISSSLALAVVVLKTRPCLTPPLPSRLKGGKEAERRDETMGRASCKNSSSLVPPFLSRRASPQSHRTTPVDVRPPYPAISAPEEPTFLQGGTRTPSMRYPATYIHVLPTVFLPTLHFFP